MKTRVVAVIMVLALVQIAFAGGILTNTNQSVQFVRMLSRNASTQIDAVYFNPAGITQLPDGFFFALHSQTITETRTITNSLLSVNGYKGDVFAPVFPDFYAVYKKGKFAASFGFLPIAGGGTADFKKGLPDLEMMALNIVAAMGISTVDLAFKGSSVYYGFQSSIAYALTDQFSASIGVRYNMAKNKYQGSIKSDEYPVAALAEVDAEQTGNGITPILGLNFKLNDKINMGLKYEMKTKMKLENKTNDDNVANMLFPNGKKNEHDIPAILAGGVSVQVCEPLMISVGGNYYFDKNADWVETDPSTGGDAIINELIDSNTWEAQIGLEYAVNEKFSVSAGYQRTQFGFKNDYYSGLSYDLNANTIGGGVEYLLSDKIALEFGGLYTMYSKKDIEAAAYTTSYEKSTWLVAAGLEYTITK